MMKTTAPSSSPVDPALSLIRVAVTGLLIAATPAFAQVEKVGTKLSGIQQSLVGLGVTIITIALLWVAYKMALQHAKWAEVSQVFYGGVMAGAAYGIATWLFG